VILLLTACTRLGSVTGCLGSVPVDDGCGSRSSFGGPTKRGSQTPRTCSTGHPRRSRNVAESRIITADDVARWARVAADDNPLHLDAEFAARTRFGRPIVHGSLLFALVSDAVQEADGRLTAAGGGELRVRFRAPVPVGSEVTLELRSGQPHLLVAGVEPVTIAIHHEEERP
jgi:acyl dehydratase